MPALLWHEAVREQYTNPFLRGGVSSRWPITPGLEKQTPEKHQHSHSPAITLDNSDLGLCHHPVPLVARFQRCQRQEATGSENYLILSCWGAASRQSLNHCPRDLASFLQHLYSLIKTQTKWADSVRIIPCFQCCNSFPPMDTYVSTSNKKFKNICKDCG